MATTTAATAAPSVADIRTRSEELGVQFYFAQFVDMYARPSAKLVPAQNLDTLVEEGAGFAGFAAGEIGQLPSDPDIAAMPDLRSFTPVPWERTLARFACDVTVEGEEWPYDPRTILRRMLAHASEKGFEFRMGLELEYFLVKQR
jgi:glutamine synthetase